MPPPKTPSLRSTLQDVRSIIAVSSCKGGVGKSTIAAHMAVELAGRGFRVGLVDADIYGPSLPSLFQLHHPPVLTNDKGQIMPVEWHALKLMSFGFLLGDSPAVMRGPMVAQYIQQLLHNTAWGTLDYLFIDMPPGTGDTQLTITQTAQLSGAVIITTRQTLSLVDVSRGILMFEKVNVPILGIIENMAYFICDQCDKKHYLFGGKDAALLKDRFGLDTLAEIPLLAQMTAPVSGSPANHFITQAVDRTIRALGTGKAGKTQLPTISFDQNDIRLQWPDQTAVTVNNRAVRASCRCALCVDEMSGRPLLNEKNIATNIAPVKITPLGNYALAIDWNDGHTSGIYPYATINKLAGK